MVTKRKKEWVQRLEDQLGDSPSLVFTDFKGLTVAQMETLRRELYERNSRLEVVKNNLARRAFQNWRDSQSEGSGEATAQAKSDVELGELSGVGPSKVESLEEAGFNSVQEVKAASVDDLAEVSGVGKATAENLQESAEKLLPDDGGSVSETQQPALSDEELDTVLEGNTALAFSGNGFVSVAETMVEFADDHDELHIKGGVLDGEYLEPDQVEDISELPTRHELISALAVGLKQPINRLARGLADPLQKLTTGLDQIKEQKEESD